MILELRDVSAAYKGKSVFKNVNLSVETGDLIALIGENGSGKSTLLKLIGKLKDIQSGEILFKGQSIYSISNYNESLAYVPQENTLISNLTVAENLELFYNESRNGIFLQKEYILEALDLKSIGDIRVKNLSGGMQKRTSVACGLLKNPELLLLDEPLASLDFKLRDIISNIISEYTHNGGTAIMSTHYLDGIEIFNRVEVIKDGGLLSGDGVSKFEVERLFYGGQ